MDRGQAKRSVSNSLCVQPSDQMRDFHLLVDVRRAIRVRDEIREAVDQSGGSDIDRIMLEGDIYGQIRRAAEGRLRVGLDDSDELEPVRRNPDLWEIRWKRGKRGEYRMYHAEPGADPALVGLRFHRKSVKGGALAVERAQDAEMDVAKERYEDEEGVKNRWGHASPCDGCA